MHVMSAPLTVKRERAETVNTLLRVIASCGRHFFRNPQTGMTVSYFEVDDCGRIWYIDKWNARRIYTHRSDWGRCFSDGGTLLSLCKALRDFIRTGQPIHPHHLGPWPEYYCDGDLWGYGEGMEQVRLAARRLGIVLDEVAS